MLIFKELTVVIVLKHMIYAYDICLTVHHLYK
jgi:hypothetical protein